MKHICCSAASLFFRTPVPTPKYFPVCEIHLPTTTSASPGTGTNLRSPDLEGPFIVAFQQSTWRSAWVTAAWQPCGDLESVELRLNSVLPQAKSILVKRPIMLASLAAHQSKKPTAQIYLHLSSGSKGRWGHLPVSESIFGWHHLGRRVAMWLAAS